MKSLRTVIVLNYQCSQHLVQVPENKRGPLINDFSKLIGNCHPASRARVNLHHWGRIEPLAARGQQGLWDNSTGGLLASNYLEESSMVS